MTDDIVIVGAARTAVGNFNFINITSEVFHRSVAPFSARPPTASQ